MIQPALIAMLMLSAFAAECPVPDPIGVASLKEHLRWNLFWNNRQLGSSQAVSLLSSSNLLGYCVESWNVCLTGERSPAGDLGRVTWVGPYDAERAAGRFTRAVSTGSRELRVTKDSDGRLALADPLRTPSSITSTNETVRLTPCSINGSELAPPIPTALRERRRPAHTRGLLAALAEFAKSSGKPVVVPHFQETDSLVYVLVHEPNGRQTPYQMSLDDPWPGWRIRPLNLNAAASEVLRQKILEYALAVVSATSMDW